MAWSTFFDLGGVAGTAAFIWQLISAGKNRGRRPRLHVLPFEADRDLKIWERPDKSILGRAVTLEVVNRGDRLAVRSVGKLTLLEGPPGLRLQRESFALHWAPVPYSGTDSGEEPFDVGSVPVRLDVIIAKPNAGPGCYIAVPLALLLPQGAPQVYLPPGSYRFEVTLSCAEGDGCRVELAVESPRQWDELAAKRIS